MAADVDASRVTVLVFTRTPIAGRVKTRLVPALGAHGAVRLHRTMLRRTVACAVEAGIGRVELWCAPSIEHPWLAEIAATFGVALERQTDGDLGMRMHHALRSACADGRGALLVGSDCPGLQSEDLRQAADALGEGADAVLGPALDGGYYLVGVRRSDSSLFSGVEWGSAGVLDATRERLRALGWRWRELGVRRDVDRPEDLDAVQALLDAAPGAKAPIF
ncbi:MAG: TIGR04282 family arsenosugar biosynthesis glycosyltransferase [Gammaproteobacteria bacterium]|nr:TIGR04282 family arsenosugar biosynthesis glycosyltransferase [Gammaproteobacteria bacterium]